MADSSEPWRRSRRTSWIPRILAPLALVAVMIAVVVIVNSTVGGGSGEDSGSKTAVEKKDGPEIPKTYVVQAGDSLTSIAEKFGVSIKRLERLNPDVDAQTLNEGTELKLH